jgi:hypothetical protein
MGNFNNNLRSCCILLLCFCPLAALADVAFPKTDAIGQSVEGLQNWILVPTNAVYPDSVQFDLKNGRIAGIVCEYSGKAINYPSVKAELQRALGVEPRVSGSVTTAWRIEAKKCAVMLTLDEEKKVLRIIVRGFGEHDDK